MNEQYERYKNSDRLDKATCCLCGIAIKLAKKVLFLSKFTHLYVSGSVISEESLLIIGVLLNIAA